MNEQAIFFAALEINDPLARSQYLDTACNHDPKLRAEVESLLAAHDRSGDFLDVPVLAQLGDAVENDDHETREQQYGDYTHIDLSFLEPSQQADSLGRLAHYEVRQVLGRGGCGIVLKAFDEKLQRTVAIKIIAPELSATSPARKRFLREARAAAGVRHNCVVSIYAVENLPIPYLVMEYLDGGTMQDKIDQTGPLDLPDVLLFGRQIAEGLAAAHAQGLIHRDIKPCNILLDAGGQSVKLGDFGLARTADDADLTRSGAVAGTPLYMSPEQARGETLDWRSDLFSLGSVLYVMCSGRPPFRAPTHYAVMKRVVEETPRPLTDIIPEIPPSLAAIIEKLHSKNPADRIQSAAEVAKWLADIERGGEYSANHPAIAATRKQRPPQVAAWIGAGLAFGLLVIAAVGFSQQKPAPRPDSPVQNRPAELIAATVAPEPKLAKEPKVIPAGVWVRRDDELVQTEPVDSQWLFGDPEWTDFFLDVETKNLCNTDRARVGCVLFRATSPDDFYRFTIDNVNEGMSTFDIADGGDVLRLCTSGRYRPPQGPWHKVHIEVRGDRHRCWVDDLELFDDRDSTHPRGEIGLGTLGVAASWRNLKVTTPDGMLLWEGFPDIEPGMFETPTRIQNYPCGAPIMPQKLVLPEDVSPDRRAAVLVISAGGRVLINGERLRTINRINKLPDEPFELTEARIDSPRITANDLKIFADTTHLYELSFFLRFSDKELAYFRNNKDLKQLRLTGSNVTGDPLRDFDLSKLTYLSVGSSKFKPENLALLKNSPDFFELHMPRLQVNDEDLAILSELSNLSRLHLTETPITNAGLAHLSNLTRMTILSLDKTAITDEGLQHLLPMTNLECLNLPSTHITDAGLDLLAQFPKLNYLQLQGTQVTQQGVEKLHAANPKCAITWDGGYLPPAKDF